MGGRRVRGDVSRSMSVCVRGRAGWRAGGWAGGDHGSNRPFGRLCSKRPGCGVRGGSGGGGDRRNGRRARVVCTPRASACDACCVRALDQEPARSYAEVQRRRRSNEGV